MAATVTALTTHLVVADADGASTFYQRAFGARELSRIVLPDGRMIHVELAIGPVVLMLADPFPEHGAPAPPADGPGPVHYLHTDDAQTLWRRALDAGAVATRPLADTFRGEREGQLRDPYGHRWGITQQVGAVSLEEMRAAAAEVFAAPAG